jgi:zinc and cadmium transporter
LAAEYLNLPILATLVAIAAAAASIALVGRRGLARTLVPLSGGLLAGIAAFGLVPELVREIGFFRAVLLVAGGYLALMAFDRFVHPICPSCAHDHNHEDAHDTLTGFAFPLLAAASVHALLDGWGLVTVRMAAGDLPAAGNAVAAAILLHKIPEGLALGTIVRSAVGRPARAIALCALAESATVAGAAVGFWLTPAEWLNYPLALAGGTFLFLGVHAVHGDWKRRGATTALVPALAGAAGAALLQQGVLMAVR